MVTMGGELALLGGEPEVTRPIPLWPAVGHPSHLEGGRADRTGNGSDCPTTRRPPPRLANCRQDLTDRLQLVH